MYAGATYSLLKRISQKLPAQLPPLIVSPPPRSPVPAASTKSKPAGEVGRAATAAQETPAAQIEDAAAAEAPVVSSLSVADRVVTEYEKLLEAIPTMARHMGKLQLDTEAMAEGERRVVRAFLVLLSLVVLLFLLLAAGWLVVCR